MPGFTGATGGGGGGMGNSFQHGFSGRPYRVVAVINNSAVDNLPCAPIFNNQNTINALNNILVNMNSISTATNGSCGTQFASVVQTELMRQIASAVIIGQDCSVEAKALAAQRGLAGGRPGVGGLGK